MTTHGSIDYQLAQIAMYCHMPVSDKKIFKVNEYLIEFEKPGTKKSDAVKLPPGLFSKIMKAAFGIKDKGNG
jgi:hypothetical protein